MKSDIAFQADGVTLRGWLFLPDHGNAPYPAVVLTHGSGAVKEQFLDRYAEVFAAAGLACLVYDHRNFGASDGQPRQEIDPVLQMRDYRNAITFIGTLPEIDPARIGAWGTSLSGGHVIMLAAIDRRVKCAVVQVPTISGSASALRRVRPDLMAGARARFDRDRAQRYAGGSPATMPIVSDDPQVACFNAGTEAYEFFQISRQVAPHRINEITLKSAEMAREYEPGIYINRISPTPLLMIVGDQDNITPTDLILEAFSRALEPKKLVLFKGGHYHPYLKAFDVASTAARDWFVEHLTGDGAGHDSV